MHITMYNCLPFALAGRGGLLCVAKEKGNRPKSPLPQGEGQGEGNPVPRPAQIKAMSLLTVDPVPFPGLRAKRRAP